ncbi:MAG: hypothetical protein H5T72_06440 [Actinobacteria bacterium]|nr:hypothetical protein [Actinomycetota bacterium]
MLPAVSRGDAAAGTGSRGGGGISRRFLTIVLVMLASCFILVGLSYYLLNLFSGMVAVPRTAVEEREAEGELLLPFEEEIAYMETSMDGRYLATVARGRTDGERLLVLDLEDGGRVVWERDIRGDRAHWAGDSLTLVFEDGGDIMSLDLRREPPTPIGLAAGPEFEEDPLPSPDGRRVLYRASIGGGNGDEFRVVGTEGGGEPLIFGKSRGPAAWDPLGNRFVCLVAGEDLSVGRDTGSIIQEADVRGGAWVDRHPCREEARYLWWPEPGSFLYVGPYARGGETRAVWFEVKPSGEEEKKFSTDGLGADFSSRFFYPERGGTRLAYRGLEGLEILDTRRRVIIRYRDVGTAGAPLAWRESAGEILWWGPGGVYRLVLE